MRVSRGLHGVGAGGFSQSSGGGVNRNDRGEGFGLACGRREIDLVQIVRRERALIQLVIDALRGSFLEDSPGLFPSGLLGRIGGEDVKLDLVRRWSELVWGGVEVFKIYANLFLFIFPSQLLAMNMVQVRLIDDFTKEGMTSQCYRIAYRSMERSLTDEEINQLQWNVREQVQSKLNVVLR